MIPPYMYNMVAETTVILAHLQLFVIPFSGKNHEKTRFRRRLKKVFPATDVEDMIGKASVCPLVL